MTEVKGGLADHEHQIAALREYDEVTVTGTIVERTDDRIDRGISGYDFHVRVENCELVEAKRAGKPLKIEPPAAPGSCAG